MRPKQNDDQGRDNVKGVEQGKGTGPVSHEVPQASGGIVVALSFDSSLQASEPDVEASDERFLDRQVQAAIGRQLRMMFNDIASEPVPDRLVQLLDELAAKSDEKP